jgi:hypothetical protein
MLTLRLSDGRRGMRLCTMEGNIFINIEDSSLTGMTGGEAVAAAKLWL